MNSDFCSSQSNGSTSIANSFNNELCIHHTSITTMLRKNGTLSTSQPTRLTALWVCVQGSNFRPKPDKIEEASL